MVFVIKYKRKLGETPAGFWLQLDFYQAGKLEGSCVLFAGKIGIINEKLYKLIGEKPRYDWIDNYFHLN